MYLYVDLMIYTEYDIWRHLLFGITHNAKKTSCVADLSHMTWVDQN